MILYKLRNKSLLQ